MSDGTRNFLYRYFGVVIGVIAIVGFIFYLYQINRGEAAIPPSVQTGFANFVVLILVAGGGYIVSRMDIAKLRDQSSQERNQQTRALIDHMDNGLSARIASQVVPPIVDKVEEVKNVVPNATDQHN